MKHADIVAWIKGEFGAIKLATPDVTIAQKVDNAFRYWNSHSALRMTEMHPASGSTVCIQLSTSMATVADVLPAVNTSMVPQDSPIRALLGISVVDYMTSDLIQLYAAYQMYQTFMATDMRWHVEQSLDPSVGPTLYVHNVPQATTALCVIGIRRYETTEDVAEEQTLDWLLQYSKALVKQADGNALRKSGLLDVKNDGQNLYDEGEKEKLKLEADLALEGRWILFGRRI